MRKHATVLCGAVAALVCVPTAAPGPSPIDDLLARCPTADEVAAVAGQVPFTFDADPTAGTLVCRASAGSADLTRLQQRAYQALLAMQGLGFRQPLPFTAGDDLYDWFVQAVRGVRFRSDIANNFCCDPANVIDIKVPNATDLQTSHWVDPRGGWGMKGFVEVMVHEARHAEGPPHTCGTNDATFDEIGAWGAQYYLNVWETLFSGPFLTAPDPYDAYYRDAGVYGDFIADHMICTAPAADLSVSIAAPPTAPRGGGLPYAITVRNGGPAAAPSVYLYSAIPPGAFLSSMLAGSGSCIGPAGGRNGSVGCALGPLDPGASAHVQLNFRTGDGSTVSNREVPWAVGTHVFGPVHDPNRANDSAGVTTTLVAQLADAQTLDAAGVDERSATLTARVDPHDTEAAFHFEYGETDAYGLATPERFIRADLGSQVVAEPITGLKSEKTYHFRVVVVNTSGARDGDDATFRTAAPCVVPRVVRMPLAAAKRSLRRAHCATGRVTRKHSPVRRRRVISQRPRAGARRPEGTRVRLVVSLGPRRRH